MGKVKAYPPSHQSDFLNPAAAVATAAAAAAAAAAAGCRRRFHYVRI